MESFVFSLLLAAAAAAVLIGGVQGKCPYAPIMRRQIEVAPTLPRFNTTEHKSAMVCIRNETKVGYKGQCDPFDPFRPIDGVCNNLLFPKLGSPMEPFQRLLPPAYDDNVEKPRVVSSVNRFRPLPSPRLASTQCHSSTGSLQALDPVRDVLFVFFGQFLDHDITGVPESEVPEPCCPQLRADGLHPDTLDGDGPCFPIPVPPGDRLNTSCLEFTRSEHIEEEATPERPREQINGLTSYVDGSNIYGSTPEDNADLRTFVNGSLIVSDTCKQLPLIPRFPCVVNTSLGVQECKGAGDLRVNEVPPLTALHTVFHRLHNKFARLIRERFPKFHDERIFQEARKITVAIYQQIVFNEWLPLAIGHEGMRLARLNERYCYNPFINPNLFNVFSAVCFRFGHTMLPFSFDTLRGRAALEETFFRPVFLQGCAGADAPAVDTVLASLLNDPAKKRDRFFVRAITDELFRDVLLAGNPPTDLVARNIARGRDHGLPPYLDFVKLFLSDFKLNNAKPATFDKPCLDAYNNVPEDIDAFVGAMTEPSFRDSIQGFLCTRVIGEQFSALRNADRFFFETADPALGFDRIRLRHIKRASMAWVLCETTSLSSVQPGAFLRPDDVDNALVNCRDIGGPNLRRLTNVFSQDPRIPVCPNTSG